MLHPAGRTALPNKPSVRKNLHDNNQVRLLGKPGGDMMVETGMLHTGRLCFVLGRRGNHADVTQTDAEELLGMEYKESTAGLINARTQSRLQTFATGGVDMFTMQRMCSFEYLERYFFYVLRGITIDLSGAVNVGTGATPQIKWLGGADGKGKGDKLGRLNNVDGAAILRELAKRANITFPANFIPVEDKEFVYEHFESGIFASDDGPFLRGRMIDSTLIKANVGDGPRTPANIGDIVAFQSLEKMLKDRGVMDWMPDGVVLSKLSSGGVGGSTQLQDDEIDSRDGQLFNVTISGPAVTSTWTHDPDMEVLPLDKVFVVVLGDVFLSAPDDADVAAAQTALKEKRMDEYETAFKAAIGDDNDAAKAARADRMNAPANQTIPNKRLTKQTITNLQVRKMTSSQMVSGSAYTKTERSRLGLPIGPNGGRYIIGGWCVGTVIDSSAARATHDGVALMGGVKRAKCTHAANIVVNVEWWSADRMFQMYMNRGANQGNRGTLRSRYDMSRRPLSEANRPAIERVLRPSPVPVPP